MKRDGDHSDDIELDQIDSYEDSHEPATTQDSTEPLRSFQHPVHSDDDVTETEDAANINQNPGYKFVTKHILKLSTPYIFGFFVSIFSETLGAKSLATLELDALAASGLVFTTQSLIVYPLGAILSAVPILAGANQGNHNFEQVGEVYRSALLYAGLISLPIMAITSFTKPILIFIGQTENVAELTQEFFRGQAIGMPFILGLIVNQQICIGVSKTLLGAVSFPINTILMTGLMNMLMLGNFGFPQLGMRGYGYAVGISAALTFLMTSLYLKYGKTFIAFQLFSCKVNLSKLKELLKLGAPITLQIILENAGLGIPMIFVGWLGTNSLIAQQIVVPFFTIFSQFYLPVTTVIIGTISKLDAEKQFNTIHIYANTATVLSLTMASVGLIIFCTASMPLISFLLDPNDPQNSEIMTLAKTLFIVHGAELIVDCTKTLATSLLRGLKNTTHASLTSGVITTFSIGLGYLLGFPATLGVTGIYLARDIGLTVAAFMLYKRFHHEIQSRFISQNISVEERASSNILNEQNESSITRRNVEDIKAAADESNALPSQPVESGRNNNFLKRIKETKLFNFWKTPQARPPAHPISPTPRTSSSSSICLVM